MKKNPRLRLDHRFTHLVTAADTLILVGDEDSIVLEGPLAGDVVRLVDGRRNAVDIAQLLEQAHRPEVVHYVILSLQRSGHIGAVDAGEPRDSMVGSPDAGPSDEAGRGRPGASALADRLQEAWSARGRLNIKSLDLAQQDGNALTLLLTDDYLHAELVEHPRSAGDGAPVVLACLGSRHVWIGPGIVAGVTACPSCLQDRLRLNLAARTLVHVDDPAGREDFKVERLATEVPRAAFEHLASAVDKITADVTWSAARQPLRVIPLDGSAPDTHPVIRLPNCPVCGDSTLTTPGADLEVRSRPRRGESGGGYRVVDPETTLDRFSPLVSALTGVIRRIRRVEVEGTDLVHSYTASHAHHYGTASIRAIKDDRRDHSGGKGKTDLDARVSALCESLERFSSVHRGSEPTRVARLSEVGHDAFHPNALMNFSDEQFATRDAWNEDQSSSFQSVPDPYNDEPIAWSEVRSLASGEVGLVPSAFVYFDFSGEGHRFCQADSNGLAGGNCLEEAILQGFLEVAERDAIALWWYNRARRPGIDLTSMGDPWVDELIAFYESRDRTVWALDLTTDLGIPTFVGLSARRPTSDGSKRGEDIIFGFGAHLDARIALTRALTELNQMLPTVLQDPEARRRQLLPDFEDAIEWWETATLQGHDYLQPCAEAPSCSVADYVTPQSTDLRDDVLYCVARAEAVGCDVLVHDLTRADVGLAVAKVIVPDLRHFWRRLGRGRLYDVPAELGWIERTTAERDMNPVSMFV